MDDQLRRRSVGPPAARSVLLTILGEYVLPRHEPVWQETLVAALQAVGYTPQTARQALSRSARDGWLKGERHGRRARMSLTDRSITLLESGARRIYSFGEPWSWDGRWLVVVVRVPENRREVRHQLRARLAWAGLGSLGGGVWLTPHVDREAEVVEAAASEDVAELLSFTAELSQLGEPRKVVGAAWDLEEVEEQYRQFMDTFRRLKVTDRESCFRAQTLLIHAWRKFPFLDPVLPQELLPERWPRERAHQLFVDRHAAWEAGAGDYVDEVERRLSPPEPVRAA